MGGRLQVFTWGGLADIRQATCLRNPCSDVWLNRKKSAEAIVAGGGQTWNNGNEPRRRAERWKFPEMKERETVCREQQTKSLAEAIGLPKNGRVEHGETEEARSTDLRESIEGNSAVGNNPDKDLLSKVLEPGNMALAYERVVRNGGAAGVDGITVKELRKYLIENYAGIKAEIREGKYKPKPVRRVEIPKPDGGVRLLGVPTATDRMLQQAVVQVLQPIFERTFSDSSYGFRPGRSAHQAIKKAKGYYEAGYRYVVDLDLEKYFDTVNHELLLNMIREEVKDESLIRLIRRFLKSGVMINGLVSETEKGTPQGGNLSPLLSNIYLTKFDKLLEERGHKFVRYADDCNIYVKSLRAAGRVMEGCVKFLEGKLKLKANRQKSATGSPKELKFLGFCLGDPKGECIIRVHEKPLKRLVARLKEITGRSRNRNIAEVMDEVNRSITGWLGYYSIAAISGKLRTLTGWLRRRIRQMLWKRWKNNKGRYRNLKLLGIEDRQAWQWANTRKGYWRIAGSGILTRALTNEYLERLGFPKIVEQYQKLHAIHRTAVCRTARTVV
jgi:group II intron reverse transcriptase/maturase